MRLELQSGRPLERELHACAAVMVPHTLTCYVFRVAAL